MKKQTLATAKSLAAGVEAEKQRRENIAQGLKFFEAAAPNWRQDADARKTHDQIVQGIRAFDEELVKYERDHAALLAAGRLLLIEENSSHAKR